MANPQGTALVVVYWSSVSGNLITKREQQHVFDTLEARKIPFRAIDVAAPEHGEVKTMLRESSPQKLVMPQMFVDEEYRAGYAAFVDALENNMLETLLSPKMDVEFPLH